MERMDPSRSKLRAAKSELTFLLRSHELMVMHHSACAAATQLIVLMAGMQKLADLALQRKTSATGLAAA